MNMYPSRGLTVMGFEIKVSRGDLMRELANPDKAEPVAQYCNEWWLAVPTGIIKDTDNIPAAWGIMECSPDGALRATKKAALLNAKPITKDFMAAVLRAAGKIDEDTIRQAVDKAQQKAWRDHDESVKREVDRRMARYEKLSQKLADFERITGKGLNEYSNVEKLAEHIKLAEDLESLYGRYDGILAIRRDMEKFLNATADIARRGEAS